MVSAVCLPAVAKPSHEIVRCHCMMQDSDVQLALGSVKGHHLEASSRVGLLWVTVYLDGM